MQVTGGTHQVIAGAGNQKLTGGKHQLFTGAAKIQFNRWSTSGNHKGEENTGNQIYVTRQTTNLKKIA